LRGGYEENREDHFALPTTVCQKALHCQEGGWGWMDGPTIRNLWDYTASKTQVMIGLGASVLADSWYKLCTNVKGLEEVINIL